MVCPYSKILCYIAFMRTAIMDIFNSPLYPQGLS